MCINCVMRSIGDNETIKYCTYAGLAIGGAVLASYQLSLAFDAATYDTSYETKYEKKTR